MCVILIGRVSEVLKIDLQSAWNCNPHGAGYAIQGKDRKVIVEKGIMTFPDLLSSLKSLDRREKIVLHLRYATHGKIDRSNCHPFKIGKTGEVLFHNGVLSSFGVSGLNGLSDSADLARVLGYLRDKKDRRKVLSSIHGKFVTFGREGLETFGSFTKIGKVLASNDRFLPLRLEEEEKETQRWLYQWA